MFQSRVVDVSKDSIMIEVTGEETKVDSMLNVLNDYGVIEVVRTGRIAMARG
jgi:acetolactate synthase-1/3 small subunit